MIQGWERKSALGIAWNLRAVVRIGIRRGRPELETSARIVGALDSFQETLQAQSATVAAAYQADAARGDGTGDEAFNAERDTGRALPLEEVVAGATALADEVIRGQL